MKTAKFFTKFRILGSRKPQKLKISDGYQNQENPHEFGFSGPENSKRIFKDSERILKSKVEKRFSRTLFIEAIKKIKLNKEKLDEIKNKLPDTIHIVYTIQYKKLAEQIKKELKDKKITGFTQIIGCSGIKTNSPILLISEGKFHALNLAKEQEVYIFNNHTLEKVTKEEIEKTQARKKAKLSKFYSSSRIGIIVSIKPGQYNLKGAEKIKEKLKKQEKKSFIFLSDNININNLENFPVDIWINTACPRIEEDSNKIINSEDYKIPH